MANSNDLTGRSTNELQEDLFYPDIRREPGDRNVRGLGFDIHPVVFPAALLIIGVFATATLILGKQTASAHSGIRGFFEGNFGWSFLLSVNLFIVVLAYFTLSRYGEITPGGVEAKEEFSDFSWMAMLPSASMDIRLMLYSVSGPLYYLSNVPGFFDTEAGSGGTGIVAITQMFFHWRLYPWAIYGLVDLGLVLFSLDRGLPLTFRSIFWPLLGERIYGQPGRLIDLVAVFAALFGLATSLDLRIAQINTGLSYILDGNMLGVLSVPNNAGMQTAPIAIITLIATAPVTAGLEGGIRRPSTVSVLLMFVLLTFVLATGATMSIFGAWVQGLRNYLGDFLSLAFLTRTLGDDASTADAWTVSYWAQWIAWSPFVGMFITRVSKGRTVYEFVFGVFVLPPLFSAVWLSTFGGSALFNSLQGNGAVLVTYNEAGQAITMFVPLEQFPFSAVSRLLVMTLIITFFVTSSDSGPLVVGHLTSGGKHNVPRTQRILWTVVEGLAALLLLYSGGLDTLQMAAIATGFPFAVVLVIMCYTVHLGLSREYELLQSEEFTERIGDLTGEDVSIDVGRSQTSVMTNVRQNPGTTDN